MTSNITGSSLEEQSFLNNDFDGKDEEFRPTESLLPIASTPTTKHNWQSKVDRLWSVCESSTANAKLLLSDSLLQPFYLPRPKGNKPKTEADVLREQQRYERIALREVYESQKQSGMSAKLIPSVARLSAKEEAISEKLLGRYRNDKRELRDLQMRIKEKATEQKQQREQVLKQIEEHRTKRSMLETNIVEENKDRRSQMEETMALRRQTLMLQITEKFQQHEQIAQQLAVNKFASNTSRLKLWLQIVFFLSKLHAMYSVILPVRQLKNQNKLKWKAVKIIQKAVRHFLHKLHPPVVTVASTGAMLPMINEHIDDDNENNPHSITTATHFTATIRPRTTSSHTTKRRLQTILQNEQNANLFKNRQEAAHIIITVLREILKKSHLLRCQLVIRKIRFAQTMIRKHQTQNQYRISILSLFLERISPVLFLHLSFIISTKPTYDSPSNLPYLETNRIKLMIQKQSYPYLANENGIQAYMIMQQNANANNSDNQSVDDIRKPMTGSSGSGGNSNGNESILIKLFQQMNSTHFYHLIRDHYNLIDIQLILKYYYYPYYNNSSGVGGVGIGGQQSSSTTNILPSHTIIQAAKSKALLSYLYTQRRSHMLHYSTFHHIYIPPKHFTMEAIQKFLKSDTTATTATTANGEEEQDKEDDIMIDPNDPLQDYLLSYQRLEVEQQELYKQRQHQHEVIFEDMFLCLFSKLRIEDIVNIYIQATKLLVQGIATTTTTTTATSNNNNNNTMIGTNKMNGLTGMTVNNNNSMLQQSNSNSNDLHHGGGGGGGGATSRRQSRRLSFGSNAPMAASLLAHQQGSGQNSRRTSKNIPFPLPPASTTTTTTTTGTPISPRKYSIASTVSSIDDDDDDSFDEDTFDRLLSGTPNANNNNNAKNASFTSPRRPSVAPNNRKSSSVGQGGEATTPLRKRLSALKK